MIVYTAAEIEDIQNEAYAEGRSDERAEWAALLEAAKCAEGVLFLLNDELEAMGSGAPRVRQMLTAAIARIESEAAEAYAIRRDERAMESQYP